MGRYFLTIYLISTFFLAAAQHQPVFRADSFRLGGNIRNYHPASSTFQLLKVVYNTPYGQQEQVIAQLDSSGHFNTSVPLFNPQEIMLDFDHTLIYLYAVPGKDLQISLDTADIRHVHTVEELAKFHNNRQVILFKGSAAAINTNLNDYMYRLNRIINPLSNEQAQNMAADQYLSWRLQKMQLQQDTLHAWQQAGVVSSLCYLRTSNYIRYSAGADVLAYWYNTTGDQSLPPVAYQNFLSTLPVNNNDAVLTDVYYDFINNYLIYLQLKGHNNPKVQELAYIAGQVNKGTGQDLLLANMAADSLHRSLPLHPATIQYLRQHIGNTAISGRIAFLNQQLQQSINNNLPDKTHLLNNMADTIPDILQVLGAKYKGNVVYVDYWAPWCVPCIEEMRQAPMLKKKFINKPVVFLYLAIHCDQSSWEKAIKREQIQGEHYRLSDQEFDLLNKRIPIVGIPRYMLIDKNGTITQRMAPRPGDLETISTAITQLLNQ